MSYYAFFDLDETIIKDKSMLAVLKHYYLRNSSNKILGKIRFEKFSENLAIFGNSAQDRASLNKFYYEQLAGLNSKKILKASQQWFTNNSDKLFNHAVLAEINKHKKEGAEIVIVTGSFFECIQPIVTYLNIPTLICARLEQRNHCYTGKMLNEPVIGMGKAAAVRDYIATRKLSLKNSYAYADDESDIYLLELAENPIVVGKNPKLLQYASKNNWSVIH